MKPTKLMHLALLFAIVFTASILFASYESSPEMKKRRADAVEHYKKTTKFKDSVINAVAAVPREFFVPADKQKQTYEEVNIPIGFGQTITNPWFVAHMTNLLELKPTDKVLEIGSGSGYQASILYQITKDVFSIEIVEPLAKQALARWKELGFTNIK